MTSRRQPQDLPVMYFGEEANRQLSAQAPVMAAVKEWMEADSMTAAVDKLFWLRVAWKKYAIAHPGTSRICERHAGMLVEEGGV